MTHTPTIELSWDNGTAYDLFISLNVLHDPEKFGLRGSWAAGVRSRLPGPEREFLQDVVPLLWPFDWVNSLPQPKNSATLLAQLASLPPEARITAIQSSQLIDSEPIRTLLNSVAEKGTWNEEDLTQCIVALQEENENRVKAPTLRRMAAVELDLWADLKASGEMLLSALTAYYDQFYAEEEQRIQETLKIALAAAKAQSRTLSLPELLEELSQGVRFDKQLNMEQLVLAPSFWATPLMIFARLSPTRELFLFGARPADMSLVPGDVVPDALYQALKALADPTRLKILRYLTEEPSTPADLARRLRLRAPTVIHHLDALRLARLVQLTLSQEGKRYAIRAEAIGRAFELLGDFLAAEEPELELAEDSEE